MSEEKQEKGSKRAKVIEMLQEGKYSSEEIIEAVGWKKPALHVLVNNLRKKGWKINKETRYRITLPPKEV